MASTSSSTSFSKIQWTENTCAEIANKDFFPLKVKEIDVQKDIITRFINFYSGGRKKQGCTVTDLIFAVISIMPQHKHTEEFIWDEKDYSASGTLFFVSPRDKDKPNHDTQEDTNDSDNTKNDSKAQENIVNETKADPIDEQKHNTNQVEQKVENDLQDDVVLVRDVIDNPELFYKEFQKSIKKIMQQHPDLFSELTDKRGSKPKIPVFSSFDWGYNKTPPKQNDPEENVPHYGPIENHAFQISCNRLLEEWHTSKVARITLKYFFGIIALILMRGTTKKDKHLKKTFAGSKILSVMSFSSDLKYFIPHNRCLWNSYKTLRKRDGSIPIMFAKIVLNSSRIDTFLRFKFLSYPKFNIFRFAVLSHTAGFGFGLISMLQNLESKLGNEGFNKLVKATYCHLTAESWITLHKFIENYKESGKDVTHNWARVISNDYFRDLSCPENLALSVILGVFIEEITKSSDIWRSAWAQDNENINEFKKRGGEMYKSFENQRQPKPKPTNVKYPSVRIVDDIDSYNWDDIETDFGDSEIDFGGMEDFGDVDSDYNDYNDYDDYNDYNDYDDYSNYDDF